MEGIPMIAAFAKLQGEHFVYYMQKYSIILGRSTETCKVDFDLSVLDEGSGPRVSRHHARIFYDFEHHHFALEVLGKKGCKIGAHSYLPGHDPVKLKSQDLVEIAGRKFYFLLPCRSISDTLAARARDARVSLLPQSSSLVLPDHPGGSYADDYGHSNGLGNQSRRFSGELDISNSYVLNADPAGTHGESDEDTEDQGLLEEEKDVVASLIVLISDLCSPGEWLPMERFHSELLERFGRNWLSARVRQQEDGSGLSTETEGRPWCSLLPLLRKYSEDFVMSTVTRGDVTSEYVGLVSIVSSGNGP